MCRQRILSFGQCCSNVHAGCFSVAPHHSRLPMQVRTVEAGDLVPANPGVLDGAADLTGLTYLNEPSILHGLALRYAEDAIYTHAGPVLIALNPFRAARCPSGSLCGLEVCCRSTVLYSQLSRKSCPLQTHTWQSSDYTVYLLSIRCRLALLGVPHCPRGDLVDIEACCSAA